MLIAISSVSSLAILPIVAGLLTLVLGAISLYVNAANNAKQTRAEISAEAYRAALAWRELLYGLELAGEADLGSLRVDYLAARAASDYHLMIVTAHSKGVADAYDAFLTAIRAACEPAIADALGATQVASDDRAYRETQLCYAREAARGASFYRPLMKARIVKDRPLPEWLT